MKLGVIAGIYLGQREWLTPTAIGFGVFFVFVVASYWRSPARRGTRVACAVLMLAVAALLLAFFLLHMWADQRPKPGANLLAIVADNSRSMTARDEGGSETRGAVMVRALSDGTTGWRHRLGQNFETRNYLADSRLLPTRDFHELAFDGDSTHAAKTLASLVERHRGQPLAGIVYLSDGVVGDIDSAALAGMPPIYPVIFAHGAPERDVAVGAATVTQTSFEDAPVTIQVEVNAAGFSGKELVARLFAVQDTANAAPSNDTPEQEQTVTVPADSGKVAIRMQLRPARAGVLFYRMHVGPKDVSTPEALTANNEAIICVNRGNAQNRILYVGGRPSWDFKFLHRALQADEQTQLIGLVRIAKREPKFEFRGRAGESSNPHFRGVGEKT